MSLVIETCIFLVIINFRMEIKHCRMEKMKSLSEFPNGEWVRSALVLNYCEKLSQEVQLIVLREVYCQNR